MSPQKNWTELQAQSSWRMFKIMAEFVDGFDRMEEFGPCISVFGSARTTAGHPHYQRAQEVAEKLVEAGYGIITGGGPGIMEAANRGAREKGGTSVGLHIELPAEAKENAFIDADKLLVFKYFFARKVMFTRYAQAFIFFPGGFGTFDELFEVLTLIQTHKIEPVPIILMGSDFWSGLIHWMEKVVCQQEKNIHADDLHLFHVCDDADEVVRIIEEHFQQSKLRPNF